MMLRQQSPSPSANWWRLWCDPVSAWSRSTGTSTRRGGWQWAWPRLVPLRWRRPRPGSSIRSPAGRSRRATGDATLTGFVLKLHAQWFAGFWGELFGGAIALLVLICLISGIAIYAPYVRAIAFGFIRRDRGPRVLQRDLHTSLGAIALGWAIVVTSTGVLLATSTLLFGAYRVGELKAMSSRVSAIPTGTPVDIDLVVRASEAASPTSLARYIVYPGTDYSSDATFTIFLYGTKRYNERVFDVGIVEAASGRVVAIQPLPKILSLIVISEPLHFGDYGGLPLKLVWLAATWATLYITLNGAWLWFTGVVSRVTWQSFDATPSSAHAGNSHAFEHSGHHRAACDSGLVEFAIPLAHADAACARG